MDFTTQMESNYARCPLLTCFICFTKLLRLEQSGSTQHGVLVCWFSWGQTSLMATTTKQSLHSCGKHMWSQHLSRHEGTETISALMAACEGNPSLTDRFSSKGPVMGASILFVLNSNKLCNKHSICQRWRSYDLIVMYHLNSVGWL